MSLLFPIYLAGIAAVSLPLIFHLIRRTPSGRTPFSSLMFLRTSPPRMVRRKSLEHWPLLLLRALALALLALAFARPFLRDDSRTALDEGPGGRTVYLLDQSASMRRTGLWEAALTALRTDLEGESADRRLGLVTFGRGSKTLVDVGGSEATGRDALELALSGLEPGWGATRLADAVVETVERCAVPGTPLRLVLLTDLQAGADLEALEGYDWPAGVELELVHLETEGGNADLREVPLAEGREEGAYVRVTNSPDALGEEFSVQWTGADGQPAGDAVALTCPPGMSRVVRVPPPVDAGTVPDRLRLLGDRADFDDVLYLAPPEELAPEVVFLGSASGGRERGLGDYLEAVLGGDPEGGSPTVTRVEAGPPVLDVRTQPLFVAALGRRGVEVPAEELLEYARRGGLVLAVLCNLDGEEQAARASEALGTLLERPPAELRVGEASSPRSFHLLAHIDFQHPLFAPFADPRYSDFTGIRFWHRRRLEGIEDAEDLRRLADFDDGMPFLLEREVGAGRVLVLCSSWETADTDWARSTKFAPLLHGVLRLGAHSELEARSFHIGDPIPIPSAAGEAAFVTSPDGSEARLEPGAERFVDAREPGIYSLRLAERELRFRVQVDPAESRTEPLDAAALERLELPLAATEATKDPETDRQERNRELEKRQKLWRWLVLAAFAALLFETTWAGRLARRTELQQG